MDELYRGTGEIHELDGKPVVTGYDWLRGTWEGGIFDRGIWEGGVFENGVMNGSSWYKGDWKNGIFMNDTEFDGLGEWFDGTWHNGVWLNVSTGNIKWNDGNWIKGKIAYRGKLYHSEVDPDTFYRDPDQYTTSDKVAGRIPKIPRIS